MKRLNEREKELLQVTISLLEKGRPETRIAEHCIRLKMTEQQVVNFLNKLTHLADPIKTTIQNEFRNLSRDGQDADDYRSAGYALKSWWYHNVATNEQKTGHLQKLFDAFFKY